MARHDKTTYIACRPGMQTQLKSTFGDGMIIEVDPEVDSPTGYEFRSRDDLASQYDLLEEEVRKETLQSADPKNARTVIVPLELDGDISTWDIELIPYIVIRFQNNQSVSTVKKAIRKVKPVVNEDGIDDALTLGAVTDALSDEGVNVLSASIAEGLAFFNATSY